MDEAYKLKAQAIQSAAIRNNFNSALPAKLRYGSYTEIHGQAEHDSRSEIKFRCAQWGGFGAWKARAGIWVCDAIGVLAHLVGTWEGINVSHIESSNNPAAETAALIGALILIVAGLLRGRLAAQIARRSIEAATEANGRLFRDREMVFNAIGEGIHSIDRDGRIIFENPAAARLLGWDASELIGKPAHATIHHTRVDGTPYPQCGCHIYEGLKTGLPRRVDNEFFWRKDGTSFPVEYTTAPVRGSDGQIIGTVVVFSDITERRRHEEQLREQRERLDLAVTATGLGLWDWNPKTGFLEVSDLWASMLGCRAEDLAKEVSTWFDRVHPDDLVVVMKSIEGAIREDSPYLCEYRMRHSDGSWRWIMDQGHITARDAQGEVIRIVGTHLDTTFRNEVEAALNEAKVTAETALRENEALHLALNSQMIVSIADRQRRIIGVNDVFCSISGYSREELIGQDHRILNSGVHAKEFWVEVWNAIAKGKPWRGEVCNRAKDGRLYWVQSTIVPIMGSDGEIEKYISIRIDITAAKQAEVELRKSSERLSLAVRASGVGVWEYDIVSNRFVCDEQMFRLYEIEHDSLSNSLDAWMSRIHPEDRQRADRELQLALLGEKGIETEYRIILPDGRIRTIRSLGMSQRDASGQPLRMVGTNWDVTANRAMEEELRNAAFKDKLTGLCNRAMLGGPSATGRSARQTAQGLPVCRAIPGLRSVQDYQ